MSDILKKITEIQQHRKMINKYLLQINILEEEIKTGEKLVYKNCQHAWEYDDTSDCYEKTRYICKTCHLWKNPYLYN